jgi:hypothetical protein
MLKSIIQSLTHKWDEQRIALEKQRKEGQKKQIFYIIKRNLAPVMVGKDFILLRRIEGLSSFHNVELRINYKKCRTEVVFGFKKSIVGERISIPDTRNDLVAVINQTIEEEVNFGLSEELGSAFPMMFPVLCRGIRAVGCIETASEVQIGFIINALP